MCDEVWITDRGREVSTQGELEEIVPVRDWLWDGLYGPDFDPELCLCPVDIRATLEAAGYTVAVGWDTHGYDFVATPNDNDAVEGS